ncbi:hypothetical protein ScalyP_jg5226 [Parmales sp. scaly parma]|nr:hypothetical protein ScalyP_jg5226 [Parmales sp. scaly parma]|tara:strand:+ start:832 stop:1122 length:291 start_codon:yes stop_codon:yes gene_type:complete
MTAIRRKKTSSSGYGRGTAEKQQQQQQSNNLRPSEFDAGKAKQEEEMWRRKIEALSAPSTFVSGAGGGGGEAVNASPSQPRGSAVEAVKRRGSKIK